MNLLKFAWKNISGNSLRSWVVASCALVLAAFALFSTLLLRGVAMSLDLATQRLGADIVVVPEGAEAKLEGALLMGNPAQFWMPKEHQELLEKIPGVEVVSPQIYLATLVGASCCSVSEMFMIAYDPETDFTVHPWLEAELPKGLALGEVIGGDYIFATEPDNGILVYGNLVKLKGNFAPTGTGLDQSLFFTMETAQEMARVSLTKAVQPLVIPEGQVSAFMIKTKPGSNNEEIAVQIYRSIAGVFPMESAKLFQSSRTQLNSLLNVIAFMMAIIWPLAILLIGIVYLMAANERRRELGVLRALGATSRYIFASLLAEAGLLAFCGASVGVFLALLGIFLFRTLISTSLGVPLFLPSYGSLAIQIGSGMFFAMIGIILAVFYPALKVSRLDPAIAMRE